LGGHIVIFGGRCRSHLGTLFDLDVVGKLHFVSTVKTIFILDLSGNSNQHDDEIFPVLKNPALV